MSRRGRALGLLIALALGAAVAVWLLLAAFPGAALSSSAVPAPAPVEVVGAGTVVASASCTDPDPQDTIAVDTPGGRRLMPLDACGSVVGALVTVRMSLDDSGPPVPARVLGTGGQGALVPNGQATTSPLTGRFAILLTGVAGLGMAGLLVAVARERTRRAGTGAPVVPTARKAPRSTARKVGERASAGRGERRVTGDGRASAARTTSRPARGRSAASCRNVSGTRRSASRPGSRRPAPGRPRH